MNNVTETRPLDLVWEAKGIGQEIGQTAKQTAYMLERGFLPAKKVGGRWCASRSVLRAFFLDTVSPKQAA